MKQNSICLVGSQIASIEESLVALLVVAHPVDGADREAILYSDDGEFVLAETLSVHGNCSTGSALVE